MNKAYERINWENYPSENTAIDEINLNKMDAALNEVDNRVVAHETTKLDVATANSMVRNISFNERTGIFTVTYLNGSTKELDTKLEKIATNFVYDEERQKLILTLIDGTTQEIDMSALITQYEFENSAYIKWTVVNGKVKAEIINGSITADKLQPNFLADVTLQANSAKASEQNAKTSEENAKQSEINAKNYADSAEPVASTANGLNPTLYNSTGAPFITFNGNGKTTQNIEKYLTALTTVSSGVQTNIIDCKSGDEVVLDCGVARTIGYYVYLEDGLSMYEESSANVQVYTFTASRKMQFIIKGGTLDDNIKITVNGSEYNNPSPTNEVPIYGVGQSRNEFDKDNANVLNAYVFTTLAQDSRYKTAYIPCNPNTDYTVQKMKSSRFGIGFTSEEPTYGISVINNLQDNSATKLTANSGASGKYLLVWYYSTDDSDETAILNSIQIEKGTKATPYKAYGAHSLSVKSTGANFFGGLPFAQALVDSGSANVVLDTDTKTVTFGYNTNNHTTKKRVLFDNFKENTQYTIILKGTHDNSGGANTSIFATNLRVVYADATGEDVRLSNTGNFEFLFTSAKDKTIDSFIYNYAEKDTTTLYYEECGIFEGVITADEFEPYTETKADIPLSSPLYEKDYIEYRMDGTGEESHKMKSVNINITRTTTITNGNVAGVMDMADKINKQNNYAIATNATFTSMSTGESGTFYENPANLVFIGTAEDTLETLKEKYNGGVVVYELAESIVTELTAEQVAEFEKLRTFDGVTHVTCEAESEIQYFCDSVSGKAVVMLNDKIESTQEEIGELSSSVASAIMVKKVSLGSKSIGASSSYTYNYSSSFVGYTAIGVCGFQVSNNSIAVTGAYIEDEKPTISVKNTTDTLANCTLYLYVLYQKTN